MISTGRKILTVALITMLLAPIGFGQKAEAPGPQYVEEKGFKGRVFEIKHREPNQLSMVIHPLGSGFKGATIQANQEFNTITVRDFPENIAAIEEALKRLDVPQSAQPDVQLHIHVLIASNAELPPSDFPGELNDVVKQLRSTLSYKNYGLMTSIIQRSQGNSREIEGSGVAESKLLGLPSPQGNPTFYNYRILHLRTDTSASTPTAIDIERFNFGLRVPLSIGSNINYQNVGFNTPISLREGERVVVGTTAMGDKGLVVVLSAKFIK